MEENLIAEMGQVQRLELRGRNGDAGPLTVLCIGAHCDDIEIGCGATLMRLAGERPLDVTWVVLSSTPVRAAEARRSAALFLERAQRRRLVVKSFKDGYFPADWRQIKRVFESLKRLATPDLVFTHERADRHQDHRIASELTWNTFRKHLVLEYEIPKYDGGLGDPNVFVQVAPSLARRKAAHLLRSYASQSGKGWFTADTFTGLMRLRGVECGAATGYAEAFHGRKIPF